MNPIKPVEQAPLKRAFSLVELSIVLVILGLLVGGVLSGQALIRAAQLRAVSTEYSRYIAATNTFKDKYFALPGDMTNAGSFWTAIGNATIDATSNSATKGNGNGDGQINSALASTSGIAAESFTFWEELALAGLIEGTYTGNTVGASPSGSQIGVDEPSSKMSNAGWGVQYRSVGWAAMPANINYGNALFFGATPTSWVDLPITAIIKPEEAWNIDTKLDDGNPLTGKVIASVTTTSAATSCTTKLDGSAPAYADTTGIYNLTNTGNSCNLAFIKAF